MILLKIQEKIINNLILDSYFYDEWLSLYNFFQIYGNRYKFVYIKLIDSLTTCKVIVKY